MKEKLAQCIKMLDYIGKNNIIFTYYSDRDEVMPFSQESDRVNKVFTFFQNGTLEYFGQAIPASKKSKVHFQNLNER